MTKRTIIVSIVVIVVAAAAIVLISQQRNSSGLAPRVPQEAPDLLPMAQRPVTDPTTVIITVADGRFIPSRVNVQVGDTVEWKNTGTKLARVSGPELNSPLLEAGQSYRVVLSKAGTIKYQDDENPAGAGGTLVVASAP